MALRREKLTRMNTGIITATTSVSRHSIVAMTASAPTMVTNEMNRSSGPWWASSGDLKQIRRHPAHELAGAVAVKKLEAQLLHMAEERRADIGLHADAERMAPVGDDKVEQRAHRIRRQHDQHHREKRAIGVLRQQRPHRVARDDRVGQIDQRHDQRAGQVEKNRPRCGLKKERKMESPDRVRYCSVVMIGAPFLRDVLVLYRSARQNASCCAACIFLLK